MDIVKINDSQFLQYIRNIKDKISLQIIPDNGDTMIAGHTTTVTIRFVNNHQEPFHFLYSVEGDSDEIRNGKHFFVYVGDRLTPVTPVMRPHGNALLRDWQYEEIKPYEHLAFTIPIHRDSTGIRVGQSLNHVAPDVEAELYMGFYLTKSAPLVWLPVGDTQPGKD
ncbi:MAG: hypothetical protein H7Y38_15355 [Armatimonadetes bacterium]|nr:hypothetical protein [Armatimonadota bacterium]